MAQIYISDVPDGTTNILQDNINGRNNENTLRSNFSGTAFPDTPVAGQHCYRTDTGIEYIYDGTVWVEVAATNTLGLDVAAAKGTLSNLSSRLNVSINPDGTLKDPTTANVDEFKVSNVTPTYVDATTFSVPDDLTGIFTAGRILKITDGAEVKYLSVVSSAFDTVTNVVIDGTITASISAVDYSLAQYGLPKASETVKGVVELATPEEVLAGTDNERVVTVKDLDYSYATIDSNRIYDGVDLTTKFASEIAGYSDVWAWIKARITAVDYSGLHVGDYIPFVMNGNTIKAQIAGIDTYYRTGDVEIGHHIDFISKDCYPTPVPWNTTDINNGDETNAAPWMVCNLKNVINTTWYNSLPAALKAQIIEKRAYIETRYTSGSTLTDSTGGAFNDIGKLWVPTEGEVYGTVHWGTKGYSSMQNAEYPIFAASWRNRIKGAGDGGPRCHWWLLSVDGGNSTSVCSVSLNGNAYGYLASYATICAPVCFRIG